ncbi:MAG: LCP family protein [Candidatus Moranbacteria bacterium]|nr:LCP family protein [Candidatus Moranbacteria bacterium]
MDVIRKPQYPPLPKPFQLPNKEEPLVSSRSATTLLRPKRRQRRGWRLTLIIIGAAGILLLGALFVALSKGISLGERLQFENSPSHSFLAQLVHLTGTFLGESSTPLRGEEEGRINILLLGRAGEHYPGKNLTDTVMIMSINTLTKQVALLSLPRDLYVPIADTAYFTKLNSVYQYGLTNATGVTPLTQTLKHVTRLPIHYFITLDFDSFEKIVDAVGGISLDVPRDLTDTRYPGKNYSYETFSIKKGWQTLDGATALKYVRERHADPDGDFGRAKRQQQVIEAIKNKVFSLGTLFNIVTVNRLIDTLGDTVKTDMSIEEMTHFFELVRTLDTKNVTTVVVDAWKQTSLLRVSHIQVGDVSAFILVPRVGNWNEISDVSQNIFERESTLKKREAVLAEHSSLTLYYQSIDRKAAENMATLARNELGFSRVSTLPLPTLNTPFEESIMVEQASVTQEKPFSTDTLLKHFSARLVPSLPFPVPRGGASDFSIVIGSDLARTFSLEATPVDPTFDDTTFSEPLPPQRKN